MAAQGNADTTDKNPLLELGIVPKGHKDQDEDSESDQKKTEVAKKPPQPKPSEDNKPNDPTSHNGNGGDGLKGKNGKNKIDTFMISQLEVMREYVPFASMLGWTAFVQALGNEWKNEDDQCDGFRKGIQWVYLSFCVIISFIYYMRQQGLINEDGLYRRRLGRKVKVHKWKFVISHVIVTILYLLTINEQPIACHLPIPRDNTEESSLLEASFTTDAPESSKDKQLSMLYIIQFAVVTLTTVTLKGFHAVSNHEEEKPAANGDDPNV